MEKEILMIKLNPSFQREVFQRVVIKYKGSIKASKILGICASSIRGYKNLYFNSIPKEIIDKLQDLKIISKQELDKEILNVFDKNDQIQKNLDIGRKRRLQNLEKIKKSIPSLKEITHSNYLDVSKWFNEYKNLVNCGFRKLIIKDKKEYIIAKYPNFTRHGFKDFKVKIPRRFLLDEEFNYFFGLWCGDRAGGKRFGVTNKNKEINDFTKKFLKKNYQNVEKILTINPCIKEPKIKYDKKFVIKNSKKGWVLSVHSNNGILSSFFHFLHSNLEEFLNISKYKPAFFAGLFDAEGNVSLYNKSFRWACKNERLVEIYSRFLKEMSLYKKYDGGCIISYNKNEFYNKIFPYLKHSKKINNTKFLCKGSGVIPNNFLDILKFLRENPQKTSKEISKALKKKKSYFELKLLSDFGFIFYKNYPYKFELTKKSQKLLGD